MARTPDRRPGPLLEEEIILDDRSADGDPTDEGAIRYVDGFFRARDSEGTFTMRFGVSGTPRVGALVMFDGTEFRAVSLLMSYDGTRMFSRTGFFVVV